jgi:hypothetical protein
LNQHPPARRYRAHLSQFTTSVLQTKNPWVVAFFAFSYPGFGHLLLHRYIAGFILIIWETFINGKANVNLGILFTLIGDFDKAKEVMDERWLMLYVGIYMFGIWDSYRTTVDLNKQYLLADHEDAALHRPNFMGAWDINFMDKRKPWVAVAWSALFPGLGHLYIHKVIAGFFLFAYTVAIMYFGHVTEGIQYTMHGRFSDAKQVLDMQWLLYLPSIYFFILYDAYTTTVDYNLLFEKEMKKFLRENYQKKEFKFPF